MIILGKEEIRKQIKDEIAWSELSPKERKFFLNYVTNGHKPQEAYLEAYKNEDDPTREIKYPDHKAQRILAKDSFRECYELFAGLLQSIVATKSHPMIYEHYMILATYDIFDYIDTDGYFKYKSIDEARAALGKKAIVITGIETTMHPKNPAITVQTVKLYPRDKALEKLAKFVKFYGAEDIGGGTSMPDININLGSTDDNIDFVAQDKKNLELIK
jgi:hypothetical protein